MFLACKLIQLFLPRLFTVQETNGIKGYQGLICVLGREFLVVDWEWIMNKATYLMHYRLLRLSFGRGKSVDFHALAPSLVNRDFMNTLAKIVYGCPLTIDAYKAGV